jgi:hypothetical protein
LAEAKSKTDFSYWQEYDANGQEIMVHINNYYPNSSVTVSGDNVTIKLGKLPDYELEDISWYIGQGFTVSDSNAKVGIDDDVFYGSTQDQKYSLPCINPNKEEVYIGFIYADRDVNITRKWSVIDHGTTIYIDCNLSMKAGWNYIVMDETKSNRSTWTASQHLPSGFNWTVVKYGWWW